MVAEGAVLLSAIASYFKCCVRRWTRWRPAGKFIALWRNHGASTVTESNVHEVMVDAAGWEGRRSLLADAVAAALGVRVEDVRERLALRGRPVLSNLSEDEALSMVARLEREGVTAFAQRSAARGHAPPVDEAPEGDAAGRPGRHRAGAHAASTMLGRPGAKDIALDNTLISGPARGAAEPSLDPSFTGDATGPDAESTLDERRVVAEALGALEPDIAGTDDTLDAAAPEAPAASGEASAWAHATAQDDVSGEPDPAASKSEAQEPTEGMGEAGSRQEGPPKRARGWSAILGDGMREPLAEAGEPASDQTDDPRRVAIPQASRLPVAGRAPEEAPQGSAREGTSEAPAVEDTMVMQPGATREPAVDTVVHAPGSVLAEQLARQTLVTASGETQQTFRPPDKLAQWTASNEPAESANPLLRAAPPEKAPSPRRWDQWLLWSALAPGGGLAYLGYGSKAISYALGSPLVIPWILAGREARERARSFTEGASIAPREPSPRAGAIFALGYWVAVVTIVGVIVGLGGLLAPTSPAPPNAAAAEAQARARLQAERAAEERESERLAEMEQARVEAERVAAEQEIEELLAQARQYCMLERYNLCRGLAERVLQLDDENAEALRLTVEAATQGLAQPQAEPTPALTTP